MENHDLIIGKNAVLEALRSEHDINKIWIAEGSGRGQMQQVVNLAKEANVLVQFVPKKKLDGMVEGNHQGVLAQVAAYQYAEIDDLFAAAKKKNETPFFLLLDEIEDPHNLGSIMRTADATGAHGIIIPKRRAVGLTATVAKLSTGAIEHIPVVRVTNMARTIDELKENGIWISCVLLYFPRVFVFPCVFAYLLCALFFLRVSFFYGRRRSGNKPTIHLQTRPMQHRCPTR